MTLPLALPAIISGGASIVGGLLGTSSAEQQNREERAWQERMAGTQYQRAVSDMRMAGLNPAMLYGKGPMSAPVSGGSRVDEGRSLSEGVRGAGAAAMSAMLMRAQINEVNSAAALKLQEKEESLARTDLTKWQEKKERSEFQMQYGGQSVEKWNQYYVTKAERELALALSQRMGLDASAAEARARTAIDWVQKRMLEHGEPAAIALEKYWKLVGMGGVIAEKGSDIFAKVAGSLGLANIGRKLLSPGQKDGGANSAKSMERRREVMDWNNNQSDLIGR